MQPLQRRLGPADVASGVEEQSGPAYSERIPTGNERSHNTAHHVGNRVYGSKKREGVHIGQGDCNTVGDTDYMRIATLRDEVATHLIRSIESRCSNTPKRVKQRNRPKRVQI